MKYLLVVLVLFELGCASKEHGSNQHFDTKTFFSEEVQRLKKDNKSILKTMMYNNRTRQLLIEDTVNWDLELAPFMAIDLGSDVFTGSFEVDTITGPGSMRITYSSKDEKMELKNAVIMLNENKVTRINYELNTRNSLFSSRKLLEYLPESGYRIQGFQKVNLLSESDYSINATWAN